MRLLRNQQLQDAAIAVVLAAAAQASIWSGQTREGPKWATVSAALLMTAPLAWRRVRPIAVAACFAAAFVFQALAAESAEAIWALPVLFLVAYGAGAYLGRREAGRNRCARPRRDLDERAARSSCCGRRQADHGAAVRLSAVGGRPRRPRPSASGACAGGARTPARGRAGGARANSGRARARRGSRGNCTTSSRMR